MDRYFYSVELIGEIKSVHFSGNVYFNDSGECKTKDYRIAEWTGLYITIDELISMINNETLWDFLYENIRYMDDLSEEEAEEVCDKYFD